MKYLFVSLILFSPVFVEAQSKSRYVGGYIVRNAGDTIKGYIYRRGLKIAPRYCKFKSAPNSEVKTFLPLEIISFGTDSARIESTKEYDRRTSKPKSRQFYRVLFDGKLDILVSKENRYFIRSDTGQFVYQLNNKDLLYYMTSDQPELKNEIKSMKFTDNKFVELLVRYHTSIDVNSYNVFLPPFTASNLDIFLFAGYGISNLKTPDESGGVVNYNKSYAPTFGYGIDYFPPVRAKKSNFSFNIQNRFTKELFQYQEKISYNSSATYQDILYEAFVMQVPLGFKFHKRLTKDVKFYVMPGLVYQKNFPQNSRSVTDNISGNEVTTSWKEMDYYFQSTVTGFISLGVEHRLSNQNKLFMDFYADYSATNNYQRTSFSASVGFKFFNFRFDE